MMEITDDVNLMTNSRWFLAHFADNNGFSGRLKVPNQNLQITTAIDQPIDGRGSRIHSKSAKLRLVTVLFEFIRRDQLPLLRS